MPAAPLPSSPPGVTPELSIVVMLTHDPELARGCLASLVRAGDELRGAETILILNAVSNAVRAVVEGEFSGARVIESSVNTGTAVAWQVGFSAAQGRSILLMHEDAELSAGTYAQLARTLESEPSAGVVGPWLDEAGAERGGINTGWLRFADGGLRLSPDDIPPEFAAAPYAVHEVSSAISLWRREAWQAIGGFEERTFPAISVEADSFAGFWARGYSVLVDPAARGRHKTGAMNTAPTLLSGPHIRHFLGSRFERLWLEKWAELVDWVPERSDTTIEATLVAMQERRQQLPQLADPPRSTQPITNPEGRDPAPTEFSDEIEARLAAAERSVLDEYTRWLIDRDIEMTARYEEVFAAYRAESEKSEALRAALARTPSKRLGRLWRRVRR